MDNVEGLDELRTFGWSLSGGVDVDNNQYGGKGQRVGNGRVGSENRRENKRGRNWRKRNGNRNGKLKSTCKFFGFLYILLRQSD